MQLFYIPALILLISVSAFTAYESCLMYRKGTPQSNRENGYLYAAISTCFSIIAICTVVFLLISFM